MSSFKQPASFDEAFQLAKSHWQASLLCAGVLLLSLLWLLRKNPSAGSKAIPSVKGGLPFFGQVFTMIKGSPWDTMTRWMLEYGGIFTFHLFGSDAVCVSDPDLLKIILATKLKIFKKDLEWTYKPFMVLLGKGLVTADGENWMRQRTVIASHLKINILDNIPLMSLKAVQGLAAKLDKVVAKGAAGEIEMAEEFRHLTLHVISEALLSLAPEECDETFAQMYLPIVEEGNLRTWHPERMYMPGPAWFAFRKAVKRLDDYVTSLVEKRWALRLAEEKERSSSGKATERKQDVLDKILDAIKKEEFRPDVVKQIRDEIKTFVLAGHETSASMLAWTLYELSCNKDTLQRVLDESKPVYATFDAASPATLPNKEQLSEGLIYTDCCLRESLRKYSVVPTVVRVAAEAINMDGYYIAKGSTLMINMQGVHHNPKIWPEPMVYRPERFLDKEKIAPFTFLPFIDGPRMCLGQFLSLLESKTVITMLLQRYQFTLIDPQEAGKKHSYMIPITPETGHRYRVSLRV